MLAVQAVSHGSAESARLAFVLAVLAVLVFRRQLLFAVVRLAIALIVIAALVGVAALAHFMGI
jgi:hypothetical protein